MIYHSDDGLIYNERKKTPEESYEGWMRSDFRGTRYELIGVLFPKYCLVIPLMEKYYDSSN